MNESKMLPGVYLYVCLAYVKYKASQDLGWRTRVTKIAFFLNIIPSLQRVSKYTNPVQASTR